MSDVTRILEQIDSGDSSAVAQLLPLVYDELRRLARAKIAQEKPGQTLQATALVHEAYVRLVGAGTANTWDSRRHFFAAAAEAMRRILIENARRRNRLKRGGDLQRNELDEVALVASEPDWKIVELDAALTKLEAKNCRQAEVVKFRYLLGMTVEETAATLGVSTSTVDRDWTCARAWLFRELSDLE